jgi:hypothetical protein
MFFGSLLDLGFRLGDVDKLERHLFPLASIGAEEVHAVAFHLVFTDELIATVLEIELDGSAEYTAYGQQ